MTAPSISTNILAFVPAKDFGISTAFYAALGFEVDGGDGVRYCEVDDNAFLLQDLYVKEWAENCMPNLFVLDGLAWLERADHIASDFPGVRTAPLVQQDWGPMMGHVWDPSGVLWNIVTIGDD